MDPNKLKQFREAAIKAGYKSADVDKFLTKKQEELATVNLVKQGQIPFETLAQSSPVLANKLLQQGFQPQASKDPEEVYADLKATQGIEEIRSGKEKPISDEESGATDLRQEFNQRIKDIDFNDLKQSYDRIASTSPTAAGDLSLIFSYMKLLDPTSVVREGEQATAENARGVPEQVRNLHNKILTGKKLTSEQRVDFRSNAAVIWNKTLENARGIKGSYDELSTKYGVNPEYVTGTFKGLENVPVPEGRAEQQSFIQRLLSGGVQNLRQAQQGAFEGATNPQFRQEQAKQAPQAVGDLGMLYAGALPVGKVLGGLLGRKAVQTTGQNVLPQTASTTAGRAANVVRGIEKVMPKSFLGKKQAEAAAKAVDKPNIENILKPAKEYVKDYPKAKSILEDYLTAAKKTKTAPDLLKRLGQWNDAFTTQKKIKPGFRADVLGKLYEGAREELTRVAPEASNYRTLIGATYEYPKTAGKALWRMSLGKFITGL